MSFTEIFASFFSGQNLAVLGAALAATLAGMGSAKGIGIVGEATAGLLIDDPSKSSKALLLQALPGTQGIYGFVTAFMILVKTGLLTANPAELTVGQGAYLLMLSLPVGIVGLYSGIKQGRVSAAGINLIAKRPGEVIKAVTAAALVETYAILALLISLLPILFFKA